ncbi:MAG: hypothetical protein ACRED9_07185 [Caulobacteraceae bacterium]
MIHHSFMRFAGPAMLVVGLWAGPTVAQTNQQLRQRVDQLEARLAAVEAQRSGDGPSQASVYRGGASTSAAAALGNLQINQLVVLQGEVADLKSALAKLQAQFAKHTHTITQYSQNPFPAGRSILTILTCSGQGKPCVSASGLRDVTVYAPSLSPPPTSSPQPYTITTSGPIIH